MTSFHLLHFQEQQTQNNVLKLPQYTYIILFDSISLKLQKMTIKGYLNVGTL